MDIYVGQEVELELALGVDGPRWQYGPKTPGYPYPMVDQGGSNIWIKAVVMDVRPRTSDPFSNKALLYIMDDSKRQWWMPTELFDNPIFFPGGPRPWAPPPPKCECGADKVYGKANATHSHWCPKHI